MSVSERVLWTCLRKQRLGFTFRRQYPVGPYVLDFFCAAAQLAVEVDGEQHADRRSLDAARDAWFARKGIETVRLPSLDLFEQGLALNRWLDVIELRCRARAAERGIEGGPRLDL